MTEKPLILFQDKRYTVCVKPSGVTSEDGAKPGMPTLLAENGQRPSVVHRLDREVGGVMVFGRDASTSAYLSKQIVEKRFEKEYLAVVSGDPGKSGVLEDLLFHDRAKNKTYTVKRERKGVKHASLEFVKLSSVDTADGTLSLVRIRLHTGRTHQIRVQFGSRRHPVAGDGKYGSALNCPLALFSRMIGFTDRDGRKLTFTARPDNVYPWSLFEREIEEV